MLRKCITVWLVVWMGMVVYIVGADTSVDAVSLASPVAHLGAVCGFAVRGTVRCDSIYLKPVTLPPLEKIYGYHALRSTGGGEYPRSYPPGGGPPYGPANIDAAYNLPQSSTNPSMIAIITAYDDPNAESDLAYYRTTFGLGDCTTANGCFTKINQSGERGPYPAPSVRWAQETSLDLDMVSAVCRNCQILLVEAQSSNVSDLGTAVNTAVNKGATVVSNSYGTGIESSSEASVCDTYYNHPGVAIVASTGDQGPGVHLPAVCPGVIAVSGTTLSSSGIETAWSNSGGGCSQYISKPSWQYSVASGCNMRAVADVSALGDPNTGFYTYDTYQYNGFYEAGGTSASAPLIAGIYGLAGNAHSLVTPAEYLWINRYAKAGMLFNIPANSTTAFSYQGGLGSPNSMSGF